MVIKYQYCSCNIYLINASSDVCETTLFSTACHHCWHFRVVDWHPRGNPGTRPAAGNYEARLFIDQKDATIHTGSYCTLLLQSIVSKDYGTVLLFKVLSGLSWQAVVCTPHELAVESVPGYLNGIGKYSRAVKSEILWNLAQIWD